MNINKEYLSEIVRSSNSFAEILRKANYSVCSSAYKNLKKEMIKYGIDFSHIKTGISSNNGRKFPHRKVLFADLIKNPIITRASLKRAIISEKLQKNECSICGKKPFHNGKELVMVLDHINGINNDNRLENLRLVCPNCNSQLSTFAGRNQKKINRCPSCRKQIGLYSKMCKKCFAKLNGINQRKVKNRPSIEVLLNDVSSIGYCATGRKYGVSDAAIRKWLRNS